MNPDMINKQKKINRIVNYCLRLNQELFSSLLITYLLLLLGETLWDGCVTSYFNMNNLLVIVIISGAIAVLTGKETNETEITDQKESIATRDYIFIICAGILGSVIIYYKIQDMGWMSYVISAVSGLLIILLSILLLEGEEENLQYEHEIDHNHSGIQ